MVAVSVIVSRPFLIGRVLILVAPFCLERHFRSESFYYKSYMVQYQLSRRAAANVGFVDCRSSFRILNLVEKLNANLKGFMHLSFHFFQAPPI